ncbi:MAG: hypothetical protein KJ067_24265 [Vicinamibacteria bacterium]|nr:hypothetical protein [Vicinamibacteria bacterium]
MFDHDLDFANEWEHWGYPPQERTPTGLRRNYHTVGPAIVWSPFFLLAHCVASLVGSWPADGYSRPYVVAVHAGTLWVFAAGVLALVRALEKRIGHWDSRLAAVVATGASPAAYYLLVVPAMSHAVVAGLACAFAALWLDARAGRGRWLALGLTAGLLAACRPQALLLTGPFLLALVVSRPPAWTDGVRLGAGGFAGFAPQAVAWWVLFGSPFTLPQGSGFLDLRAPHLLDVLFATDKALFNWVPLAWVALVGSLFGMHRDRIAFAAGLAALGGTAWVNGSVMGLSGPDWAGSDARLVPAASIFSFRCSSWALRTPSEPCAGTPLSVRLCSGPPRSPGTRDSSGSTKRVLIQTARRRWPPWPRVRSASRIRLRTESWARWLADPAEPLLTSSSSGSTSTTTLPSTARST